MTSERELCERYADLLDDADDARMLELVRELEGAYPQFHPPESLQRLAVRALIPGSGAQRVIATGTEPAGPSSPGTAGASGTDGHASRPAPIRRRGPRGHVMRVAGGTLDAVGLLAAAAALVVIALGALTILPDARPAPAPAAGPTPQPARAVAPPPAARLAALDYVLGIEPWSRYIGDGDLGREPYLAKTVDGYTVTLVRAYADRRFVVLALLVDGPRGRSLWDTHLGAAPPGPEGPTPRLSVAAHRSDGRRNARAFEASWHYRGAHVLYSPIPQVSAGESEVAVRLEIPLIATRELLIPDAEGTWEYPDPCDERSQPLRCVTVRGPFVFELTVPIETQTPYLAEADAPHPSLPEDRRSWPFADAATRFLDAWVRYVAAAEPDDRRAHETTARALLSPEMNRRVRDLRTLDVPRLRTGDGTAQLKANRQWQTDTWSERRATLPVAWWIDGKIAVRRLVFDRTAIGWRIGGIEPQEPHPEPRNLWGPSGLYDPGLPGEIPLMRDGAVPPRWFGDPPSE